MLRLTGLPARARYPRATVSHGEGRIEILFSGEEGSTRIDVDLRYLTGVDDLEATELRLLAQLQELGYEVAWRPEEEPKLT